MRIRELSVRERMTWGECCICNAADGDPCVFDFDKVQTHDVLRLGDGTCAHSARLRAAPERVREVPA